MEYALHFERFILSVAQHYQITAGAVSRE